jgi:hypothetical protein
VIVVSPDADLRRRAEGGLARRLRDAVAATALVPDVDISDREAVRTALLSSGADGVMLVRPVGVDERVNMEESEQFFVEYPSMWNYWDSQMLVFAMPGPVSVERVVTVEIAIYSIADERIVWAGRVKATNPRSLRVLLDEIVEKGSKELKRQGLI